MRRGFQLTSVLLAWFLATGAQWDVVQVIGWARMISTYTETMSVCEAVQKIVDGDMCNVCRAVSDAKQGDNQATVPGGKAETKLVLLLQSAQSAVVAVSPFESWSLSDQLVVTTERAEPALRPPRV